MNIIEAIRLDNLEEVKKAIAEGKDICFKNRADWTLLHFAVYYGSFEIINELISAGHDINAMDNGQRTPLSYAMDYSLEELIEYSKQSGAV